VRGGRARAVAPRRRDDDGRGAAAFARDDSVLVARAREFLGRGPSDAVPLIAHVCQLPAPPAAVARHLAEVLLSGEPAFRLEADGRWGLAAPQIPVAPAIASRPLHALSFAVVDVETTGTRATYGDRIVEFAAVTVANGEIADVYETLVNPEQPISGFVTRLTRITSSMVAGAPKFGEVCPAVMRALRGKLFVAHNATFDWRFVHTEIVRASGERLLGERLCTVKLARSLLPQLRRRSLDSVAHYFGVEITARHRAGGDALATAKVLVRLLDLAQDRGCATLEDLRALVRPTPAAKRSRRRRRMPRWMDRDDHA
jgi:DNA polymerase-3 subunit epsilon